MIEDARVLAALEVQRGKYLVSILPADSCRCRPTLNENRPAGLSRPLGAPELI
jgi:hypothetical protein